MPRKNPAYSKWYYRRLRYGVRKAYAKRHEENTLALTYLKDLSKKDQNLFIKQLREDIIDLYNLRENSELDAPGNRWLRDVLLLEPKTKSRDRSMIQLLIGYCQKYLWWGWILKIRKLRYLSVSLVVLALLVVVGPKIFPRNSGLQILDANKPYYSNCYFSADTTKHRVLILPFKYIDGNRWKEDKGFILKQRLDSLSIADSLNLEVKFCREIQPTAYQDDYYVALKQQYKSDHIIYGFLDDGYSCSEDKVCLNFIADYQISKGILNHSKTSVNYGKDFEMVDNLSFAKGRLQEDMDYLMYFNAMLGANEKKDFYKVITYSNKLINRENDLRGLVHRARGVSYFFLLKDDLALIELYKALEYTRNDPITYIMLGRIYSMYQKDKLAKFYYQKVNVNVLTRAEIGALFEVNNRLGYHTDNLELLTHFIELKPEETAFLHLLRSHSFRMLGNVHHARQDSLFAQNYRKSHPQTELVNPLSIGMLEDMYVELRLRMLSKFNDAYGNRKSVDSIEKDKCRLLMFDRTNSVNKNFEFPKGCESSWDKIFSIDKKVKEKYFN